MTIEKIERRITILEDVEAIKKLKARYCAVCDDNHNSDEITKLFVADGIWEGAGFGRHKGHDAIRSLFKLFQKTITFSQHNVMNPIIEVDGEMARGVWYLFGPFTFQKGNRPFWLAARYEDDYVKVNGEWKFAHLRAIPRMSVPYEKGWAEKGPLGGLK
jgi:hypothetical protein